MVLRILIERRRTLSLLREEQLLAEGRVDDARIKYPELAKKREELDGESVLDVLIDADPSGNQKYLMGASRILHNDMMKAEETHDHKPFWGKQWPEDASDDIYSPWGIAKNIAGFLPQYHQLMPYIRDQDAPFKDINNIKNHSAFEAVVRTAQNKKETAEKEKEEKKRLSKLASDESRVIKATDYHIIRRPESQVASCYYGRGTTWCVTATESENYWDHYKKQGKSFYFINTRRNDVSPDHKIMTLVYGPDGELDDDEPRKNASNDTLDEEDFMGAIMEGLLGTETMNAIVSFEMEEPYNKKIIVDTLSNFPEFDRHLPSWQMLQTASRNTGNQGSRVDHEALKDLVEMFKDDVARPYINEIYKITQQDVEENPVDAISEEAYEEALAEYSFNRMDVRLMFPHETGAETVYWESYTYVDVEELIENNTLGYVWRIPLEDVDDSDLYSAVDDALTEANVYPEYIEQDTYSNPAEFHIKVTNGYGDLDSFKSFLYDVEDEDSSMTESFDEALLEQLEEAEIIGSPEKMEQEAEEARRLTRDYEYWPDPEEKKKQLELPLQEHKIRIKITKKRQ